MVRLETHRDGDVHRHAQLLHGNGQTAGVCDFTQGAAQSVAGGAAGAAVQSRVPRRARLPMEDLWIHRVHSILFGR